MSTTPPGAGPGDLSLDSLIRELRQRADADFAAPPERHQPGRHQVDLATIGMRVSITRTRYPNRPDGDDQYAVTVSNLGLAGVPEEAATWRVLYAAFGEGANRAVERPGGPAVRMFRVPAAAVAEA